MKKKTAIALITGGVVVCLAGIFFFLILPLVSSQQQPPVGLQTIDGSIYYYDETGTAVTGWQTIDGKQYFFDPNTGRAVHGWYTNEAGDTYYFGSGGYALTGQQELGGKMYSFDEDGKLITDVDGSSFVWQIKDGNYYCVDASGNYVTGLQEINGSLYYFNESGVRQTGWQTIEGKKYYFSTLDGRAAKGWYFDGDDTYYFGDDGYAVTGQQTIGGKKYNFDEEGKQVKLSTSNGATQVNSKPTSSSSAAASSSQGGAQNPAPPAEVEGFKWIQRGDSFYYEDGSGNRKTGLTEIDGVLYYFNNDGVRQSGWQEISGKKYYFAADGKGTKGWLELGGKTYYLGQNWYVLTGLQKIGDDQYYFNGDGERLSGWHEIDGNLYHFDTQTGSATKGWFTTNTPHTNVQQAQASTFAATAASNLEATYYFGPDGFALKGVITVDGKIYYLNDSYMRQTGWQTVAGKLYCFATADGSAVVGWSDLPEEGGKCYLSPETGYALTGLQTIQGEGLYYFSLQGAMQTGWCTIEGKRYCFDGETGRALTNQFKPDENGAVCYLGKDGFALVGLQNIEGATYYFDTNGARQTGWQKVDGKYYFFNAEAADAAVKDTWMQREGLWCFLGKDGYALTGLASIDGARYFFDGNGLRQTGWQTWEKQLYYFGADGKALLGWQTLGGDKYYFAEDAHACVGPFKVGESWFFFNESGAMQTGWQTYGGKYYNLNADGTAKLGWYREGGDRYYFDTAYGHALVGEHKIENVTYIFDDHGRVVDEMWDNYTWRVDEETGNKYFSGADGRYVTGLLTIKGELYFFNEQGVMQTGRHVVENFVYWFNPEGAAYRGWYTDESASVIYYFDQQGAYALTGLQSIDKETYLFSEEGAMQFGWHTIGNEKYYFGADGKAPKGLFKDADEKSYLFGDGGYALVGLQKYGEERYFLDADGVAQQGWQTADGNKYFFSASNYAALKKWYVEGDNNYYFGEDGYAVNGLVTIDGNKYYFSDCVRQTGWQIIKGNRYYFDEAGIAKGGWFTDEATQATYYFGAEKYALIGTHVIEGVEYYFNQDGALIKTETPTTSTWVTEDGKTYYLDANGDKLKGLNTVDNYQYYFDEETGEMKTGWVELQAKRYYFGTDGKGVTGWQTIDGQTYYFGIAGFALTGEQNINGADYVFDDKGVLQTEGAPEANKWLEEDGKYYYINSEGQRATGLQNIGGTIYYFGEDGARQSGKVTVDGKHYFFGGEDDRALKGWQQLEGRWYLFDVNTAVQLLGWQYRGLEDGGTATHFYYEDGTSPLGWIEVNGIERYFFADGRMAIGWETIEEHTYYFLTSGLKATGQVTIDGTIHYFNEQGHLMTGWQTENGKRYYFTIDGASKGWTEIEERWYLFDTEEGHQLFGWQYRPLQNGTTHTFYYDETNGALPAAGFGDVNGTYRYIYPDGHMAIGWQTIENNRYYFDTNGKMATGWLAIGGVQYCFSSSGVLQTGWQTNAEGARYYFGENGPLTGWNKISNRWYVFASNGVQQLGWQARTESGKTLQYFYFADGTLPAAGWTNAIEAQNRYVLADGQMAQGWQVLETGRYYFQAKGVATTGWQQLESRWYVFNSAGVQQLGWQQKQVADGKVHYFYYANGTLPAKGWVEGITIDGVTTKRYVLDDGQFAKGWYAPNEYTYYFTEHGVFLTGRHTIDGKVCMFNTNGHYVPPPTITGVTFDTGWSATKTVTVNGMAHSQVHDKTLEYSFDGGITWQTANTKQYNAGTIIPAGTIRIRDSVGNVVSYNTSITLENTGVAYGIDVSAHQGLINWQAVKESGVQFAIIRSLCWDKSTNGYRIDPYFEYNVTNAKANGIKVGTYLYSYAYSRDEMLQEVLYFLNSAPIQSMLNSGVLFDMPVYIDYEDPLITSNTANLTIDQRTDIVRFGMQVLEQRSGYRFVPGFYTYYSFAKNVINGAQLQAEGYEFWLARFNTAGHGWSPSPPMWQYSSTGSVPGISTNVDLNYCYKDYSYINGGTVPPPITTHSLTVTNQYGQVVTASAASILAQIVQNEVGGFSSTEVYKAQAVAAQSWILYQNSQGYTAPQVSLKTPTTAVQNAVNEVATQALYYNNQAAFTPYFAYSSGTTNNGQYWGNNLPYLQSVASSWDTAKGASTGQISYGDLKARLEAVYGSGITNGYAPQDWIKIVSTNSAGYVTKVSVCGRNPTVDYFYQTIIRYSNGSGGLVYPIKSPNFSVSFNGSNLWTFVSKGWGHGVGMSQVGANGMATAGKKYTEILAYFYPGTKLVYI